MKQETFIKYNTEEPFAAVYITTVETLCPVCKALIKYIVPDDINLRSYQKENEFLKKEIDRLHYELGKMEQIRKLNHGFH